MKSRIASTAIATLMMTAGVAAAQSVPVTVSNQGSTVSPSANASAVTLGSFTLVSNQNSQANIASIPLTLTTGSGGNPSDLSSCQVYSSNGSAIGASGLSSLSNNTQTVTFNSPVQLGGNQSANFTVRCNVGSNIASGATYQFSAGTPTLTGSASNPSGAALSVALGTTPVVRPGAQDAPMAVITFSASNSNSSVQVSSLPISLSFGGGANAGSVSDCRIRPLGNLGTALNNGANVSTTIVSGSNVITLDSPLAVSAGNSTSVVLTCDISGSAPSGGTVLVSVTPNSIPATISGSSTAVTPTTATTTNGNIGPTSGSVLISDSAPVTSGPLIPGAPNTGLGGNGTTDILVLASSALAVLFGALLLRRRVA